MSELFREIEDDIRQENFERLWQHIGKFMAAISIVVIAATIAVVVVRDHRKSQAAERTSRFIEGSNRLDAGDYKGAITAFSALADGGESPYYGIAMLRKAQAQTADGDKKGAALTYAALAAHGGTFGGLAEMPADADAGKIVTLDRASPFYYTLAEWRGWQLLRAGKKDEAVKQFLALRDDIEAPFSLRRRMDGVVQQLAPEKTTGDEQVKGKK